MQPRLATKLLQRKWLRSKLLFDNFTARLSMLFFNIGKRVICLLDTIYCECKQFLVVDKLFSGSELMSHYTHEFLSFLKQIQINHIYLHFTIVIAALYPVYMDFTNC